MTMGFHLRAQNDMGNGSGLEVKGTAIGSQATLKWMPQNPDTFQNAKTNGYKITRYTLTNLAGQDLSPEVSKATKVVVASNIKPITISQWDSLTGGIHPYDSLLRHGFLSQAFNFQPSGTKLGDALDYNEKKRNAYVYAALISDSDLLLAKSLGLAFTDQSIIPGLKYRYYININNMNVSGSTVVSPINLNDLPSPTGLESSANDKKISIMWNGEGLNEYYTFYDIFRSEDNGVNFIKVNTSPFVYMADQKENDHTVVFSDEVPAYGVVYTYKVRGISPYGIDGPFSETTLASAQHPRLNLQTSIENITFATDGSALISWKITGKDVDGLTTDFTPYIDRFDVLYRENLTDTAWVLNTTPIGNSLREFATTPSAPQGLYFIRATDIYDYEYTSVPFLGQIKDSIPPIIPVGLVGAITPDGRIELNWTSNPEDDLLGYKIYMSYGTVNPFTQITSTHVTGTQYKTVIKDGNANDTIFYKISAVDNRYNISELSASVYLLIPDRTPPSDPVLKRITATKEGMRMAWALSESKDLSHHFLQRKYKTAVNWTNVLTIPAGELKYVPMPLLTDEFEPANYLDTTSLELRTYDFRLMAVDSSNNKSISQVISLKPYDDGNRGMIRPFDAKLVPIGAVYNPTTQPPASASPGTVATYYPDITDLNDPKNINPNGETPKSPQKRAKANVVRLEWEYQTAFPSSVVAFQIFQKKPSSTPGNVSQALPANPPFILVKTIHVRDAKQIAMMNNLNTYVVFIEDIPGRKDMTTPVEYKIIANHQDGGFSMPVTDSVTLPPISF